jgi:hypothetical protein
MTARGSETGRGSEAAGSRSSNIHPAVNDGQWHSFGNAGNSARSGQAQNVRGSANGTLSAHNDGFADGNWHSFSSSSGVTSRSGFAGGVSHGYGWSGGNGWHGGYGWGGYGWRGYGYGGGCCWGGWAWGFGLGGPYWGPYWGFAWSPYWYSPYWYNPYWYGTAYDPAYYSYDWSDNPPPYRPDSQASQNDPNANLSPNFGIGAGANGDGSQFDDSQFDVNHDNGSSNSHSSAVLTTGVS